MEEPNQWYSESSSQPEPDEDESVYMYQQGEHVGMQQRLDDPTMAAPKNAFCRDPHNTSGVVQRFGSASALPNLSFGALVAENKEQGQPSSSSSGILSSFGRLPAASTLNFSGGDWPDGAIDGVQLEPERRSRPPTQEHVLAERKRREKMQQQFVALATMVPDLTKTDKISILGSTIQYVKQLEEKVKTLEKQRARQTSSESTESEGRGHISSTGNQHPSGPSVSTYGICDSIPTVEATSLDDTVLLKICCERRSGVLVKIVSELESLGLLIINTSVLPFSESYFSISITAKIGEGFSTIVDLVKNLTTALRNFSSKNMQKGNE